MTKKQFEFEVKKLGFTPLGDGPLGPTYRNDASQSIIGGGELSEPPTKENYVAILVTLQARRS